MVQITENTIEIFAIVCTPVDAHVARLSTCLVHQQRLGARVSMSISYVYRHLVFGSFPSCLVIDGIYVRQILIVKCKSLLM